MIGTPEPPCGVARAVFPSAKGGLGTGSGNSVVVVNRQLGLPRRVTVTTRSEKRATTGRSRTFQVLVARTPDNCVMPCPGLRLDIGHPTRGRSTRFSPPHLGILPARGESDQIGGRR